MGLSPSLYKSSVFYPFLPLYKNVPPKKIDYLAIDQLIEIYNSNIDYSVENKSVLTKLGANFCNLFSI